MRVVISKQKANQSDQMPANRHKERFEFHVTISKWVQTAPTLSVLLLYFRAAKRVL